MASAYPVTRREPIIPAGVFRRAPFVEGKRDDVRPLAAKSRATRGHGTHKSHRIVAAQEYGGGYDLGDFMED